VARGARNGRKRQSPSDQSGKGNENEQRHVRVVALNV
jgi:hypothetical protein